MIPTWSQHLIMSEKRRKKRLKSRSHSSLPKATPKTSFPSSITSEPRMEEPMKSGSNQHWHAHWMIMRENTTCSKKKMEILMVQTSEKAWQLYFLYAFLKMSWNLKDRPRADWGHQKPEMRRIQSFMRMLQLSLKKIKQSLACWSTARYPHKEPGKRQEKQEMKRETENPNKRRKWP